MIDQFTILAEASAASAEVSGAAITSMWDFLVKGGIMMIPIGIASLVALAVFVERLVSLQKTNIVPGGFVDELDKRLGKNRSDALKHCESSNSPVARMLAAGTRQLDRPVEAVEKHLTDAGNREVVGLRRYLRLLSVIAAVTPLMGLLGTILGMIRAFQTVAVSGDALGKTELLAGGIYEAMITTAAGLVVAIPVLMAYHFVSSKVEARTHDLNHAAMDFVDRWANGSAAAATADTGAPASNGQRLAARS